MDNGKSGWITAHETCSSCGYKCFGIIPTDAPLTGLECARCHKMTSAVDAEDLKLISDGLREFKRLH